MSASEPQNLIGIESSEYDIRLLELDRASTIVLTDIDGTLIAEKALDGEDQYLTLEQKKEKAMSHDLIRDEKLLTQDPGVRIIGFSSMTLSDFITRKCFPNQDGTVTEKWEINYNPEGEELNPKCRRTDLLRYLKKAGLKFGGVITNGDLAFGRGPGAVFFETYLSVAAEFEAVKNLPDNDERKQKFVAETAGKEILITEWIHKTEKIISSYPIYKQLLDNSKDYFENEKSYNQGLHKIGMLLSLLESGKAKPKKIILVDDGVGCVQAIMAMIAIHNRAYPDETIELDVVYFRNDDCFGSKNMVARHFYDKPLTPITMQDMEVLERLKLNSKKIVDPLTRLISICAKANPEALFFLAKAVLNGEFGFKDRAAAYRLARFALRFSESKEFKTSIEIFVKKNNLTAPDGGKVEKRELQQLLDHLEPFVLNKGGLLWARLKAWKKQQLAEKGIKSDKNFVPYQAVYKDVEMYVRYNAKLYAYYTLMNRYLSCTDPLELQAIEQCLEEYFRPLLIDEKPFSPEVYFYPGEEKKGIDQELISIQRIPGKHDFSLVQQAFLSNALQFQDIIKDQALKDKLRENITIVVGSKKRINPDIIRFCEEADPNALFLLAQAALKGNGVVKDRVSAYYLALLALELASRAGKGNGIARFIWDNFSLPVEGQCKEGFPKIKGYNAKDLFERYQRSIAAKEKEEYLPSAQSSRSANDKKEIQILQQDHRSLEAIGLELIAVIENKLEELKSDDSKILVRAALAQLIIDIENFRVNEQGKCGLTASILIRDTLSRLMAQEELDISWFMPKVMPLAQEYDSFASAIDNSLVWEVKGEEDTEVNLVTHYDELLKKDKELREKLAQEAKEEAIILLEPGKLRQPLSDLYSIVYNGINTRILETSLGGVVMKSISTQLYDYGDSSLQNKRVTSFAAEIIGLIKAVDKGIRTPHRPESSEERKELVKRLFDVITVAKKGYEEAKKDANRTTFHVSSKSAGRAKVYADIQEAAGKILHIFQAAYPEEVNAVADGMHITVAPRK